MKIQFVIIIMEDFIKIFNERILNDEFLQDEYFYNVSAGKLTDDKVNPIEDFFILRGFLNFESPTQTARFIKRNEKVVLLRIRIMNLDYLHTVPEKNLARMHQVLYERVREKALWYMDFCKNRKWVWDLVEDLDGVI